MNQNKFTYLFEERDNGYGGCKHIYFSCNKEITQEMAERFIKLVNIAPGRTGSTFKDFQAGAKQEGISIDELHGQHRVDGVLKNIMGNY
jgi:hypothetical protein